jgi:GH25 family lysozyme M1 (1,4-beta-N-acetylmuramidase)
MRLTRQRLILGSAALVLVAVTVTAATTSFASPPPHGVTGDGGRADAAAAAPGSQAGLGTADPAVSGPTGIDVSAYDHGNGGLDWTSLKASGLSFTYIKATEGTDYLNPYYAGDLAAAKSAGLYAGAYAFGRPDLGNPVGQADYFVDNMHWARDGRTLPPFVDMEWPYFDGVDSCYSMSASSIVSWLHSFLTELHARTGVTPMIYTAASWWDPCTADNTSFGSYLLDVSSCTASPALPSGWGTWTIWQYDIPGCSSPRFDEDVFNGSLSGLGALAGRHAARGDFDGDGRTDPTLFRPSTGTWYTHLSTSGNNTSFTWGSDGDIPVVADYDGDGKADQAMFRPSTGTWYFRYSSTLNTGSLTWGDSGDIPMAGDFDGDGKADPTLFRPSTGTWYTHLSTTGNNTSFTWGNNGDIPLVADYDGDGKADQALYRPSTGTWYFRYSSTLNTGTLQWGDNGDIPAE